jgi:hypothetical protein
MLAGLRRLQPDMILSIAATVISLCALITTYWQTKINREWQQASVWPRLAFGESKRTDSDTKTAMYDLKLGNTGIGPALIVRMTVKYRGQILPEDSEQPRLSAFFYKAAKEYKVQSTGRKLTTSQFELRGGRVMAPDKGITLLNIEGDIAYHAAILEGLKHLEVIIEYSSVYGETWQITYPKDSHRFVGWNEAEVH